MTISNGCFFIMLPLSVAVVSTPGTDLDAVAVLFDRYRVFYGQVSDLALARQFLSQRVIEQQSIILVAKMADFKVGFAQLYPTFSSIHCCRTWVLNDLYLDKEYRSLGIGRALLQEIISLAKIANVQRITLETAEHNFVAQKLYQQCGFIVESGFKSYALVINPKI